MYDEYDESNYENYHIFNKKLLLMYLKGKKMSIQIFCNKYNFPYKVIDDFLNDIYINLMLTDVMRIANIICVTVRNLIYF